ncbi:class I SAM-dependent methyltransferase [Pedobacter endophyticus]|uniref:Class I SAM-dependent methyltransferase n=1 Tax=Pedobacter endophyticus TaxID=2789740 RepID=A0A7U3SPG2_9SPHI|nr:class I SAM-dependent methyltransferase [Pedobacter endophyticus]QPH38583.1 class I SAM-dependent methyltransferase [Pedobacter endophyticus]
MLNNYDKIAKHYDFLSRLVFSKSQVNAQINQLKYISKGDCILIVGGGTGWILEEIAALYPSGIEITYVEISEKMIDISKARHCGLNKVILVNLGIEEFESDRAFDIIATPFLFDNFSKQRAEGIFKKLDKLLKNEGLWFMADFTTDHKNGRWWKKLFLKIMYTFFKMAGNVEARSLVNMTTYFDKASYLPMHEAFYYGRFIKATIYRKLK